MSEKLDFDERASQRNEAIHMTADVKNSRGEVLEALELGKGEKVLDVGSGAGFLALDMAKIVGSSGRVCGLDVSEAQQKMWRKRCAEYPWAEFHEGDATNLPFVEGEFDAVVSTQVLEYVANIDASLAEIFRVLRPGGRVLILDTDWESIVWHSSDRERMDKILKVWEQHLVDPRLPRILTPSLKKAGFSISKRLLLPMFNPEYSEDIFSRWILDYMVGFIGGRDGVTQEEVEDWAEDLRELGERGEYFFSLNRYLFLAVKSG